MPQPYQQCTRCVMDTTALKISFDAEGRCNYCRDFITRLAAYQPSNPAHLRDKLNALVAQVKRDGAGKPYDCIVGLSGGADSSYTLYLAKESGLRPLAVHMDNGWNSELAVNNIENLVRKLGVDLHTHVVNWQEYKKLMQAFFDADVLDVEILYDNAMLATNYQLAAKHNVKWILGGTNTTTEGMRMPAAWNWFKYDKRNIKQLSRRSGVRIDTFPLIGTLDFVFYRYARGISWVSFLDYVDYFKPRCTELLVEKLGYRTYPYKHYESIFTRFYQGYLLPQKFNIDKRRLHLSTLIISGQMTRDAALELIKQIPYPSESALRDDIDYFLKKMGWRESQLKEYLARPQIPHAHYGTEQPLWAWMEKVAKRTGIVR